MTLARRDKTNTRRPTARASGPDGNGGLINVAGDFREIQGTMWSHDHRFFFTAENVYKGISCMINYYSGPDRGNEALDDGVNLRLPSGTLLDYGNLDFDVNLIVSDPAYDADGPVCLRHLRYRRLPRRHAAASTSPMRRFSRCCRGSTASASSTPACRASSSLRSADASGKAVPFQFIANDGNLVVNPIPLTALDEQGMAERYDIVVDFSTFASATRLIWSTCWSRPTAASPRARVAGEGARAAMPTDPCVGPILRVPRRRATCPERRRPGRHPALDRSRSEPWCRQSLTEQIPIVDAGARRGSSSWAGRGTAIRARPNGQCIPDCPETASSPGPSRSTVGQAHSMNANRISLLIPKPGEIEHWTYINGGGGWDHPIHLHFEEGVTMNRGSDTIPATEKLVRKDVWRLRPAGTGHSSRSSSANTAAPM